MSNRRSGSVVGVPRAVVFDLDGVLIDSETIWNRVRRELVADVGGRWTPEADRAIMGMSPVEWRRYLAVTLGVPLGEDEIGRRVVGGMVAAYRERLPLVPGAVAAVRAVGAERMLGLASSSDRVLIDTVLDAAGIADAFAATVSSEEVARGKPSPDVYREACRRLGVAPGDATAIEDSSNGLRSAHAAGLGVVAIPNREFWPADDALALAGLVLGDVAALTPAALDAAGL